MAVASLVPDEEPFAAVSFLGDHNPKFLPPDSHSQVYLKAECSVGGRLKNRSILTSFEAAGL